MLKFCSYLPVVLTIFMCFSKYISKLIVNVILWKTSYALIIGGVGITQSIFSAIYGPGECFAVGPMAVLRKTLCHLSCCCDKQLGRSSGRKGRSIVAQSSRVQSITVEKYAAEAWETWLYFIHSETNTGLNLASFLLRFQDPVPETGPISLFSRVNNVFCEAAEGDCRQHQALKPQCSCQRKRGAVSQIL